MDKETRKDLELIFADAIVKDLDLSNWDRHVRLVVMAGKKPTSLGYDSFYEVDFLDVLDLSWKSSHIGKQPDNPEQHCQWTIFESEIEDCSDGYAIKLFGPVPAPLLVLTCRDVQIASFPESWIRAVNPTWTRSTSALVRPSLEELAGSTQNPK